MDNFQAIRSSHLVEDILIIDGQPGCGKTLFSTLISHMKRIELIQFSSHIENICGLYDLKKITLDVCKTMVEIEIDLLIYESMMGRNTNFRFSDISSAFRNRQLAKYVKRLFMKGDEYVPERIRSENPILSLTTHNLLGYSVPIFESFPKKTKIIEIVRHPLYMLIQMALNYETMLRTDSSRFFYVHIEKDGEICPFWAVDWPHKFSSLSLVDKAILEMYFMSKKTEAFKKENPSIDILTIPFENFVIPLLT